MDSPLVSIICVSYNHEQFVAEAIASVFSQTYSNIELIVVDDASTDRSTDVIARSIHDHPKIQFLSLRENVGHCKAFNLGWNVSKGEFVIDLAGDDVLLPERVAIGVSAFQELPADFGVQFGDAELIDAAGARIGFHSDRFPHKRVPAGDIYVHVISRYFICSPTMMLRRTVLQQLSGYDETLLYEDFDLWVRSSRTFLYSYCPTPLVRKRLLPGSMSQTQYRKGSGQMYSTFRVCEKIRRLNRNQAERKALRRRIRYEMKKALQVGEWRLAWKYFMLRAG